MDWQTKEYMDNRFDELEEKINLILDHLNINDDPVDNYDEDKDEEENVNI